MSNDRYQEIREALAMGPIPGRREIGSEYGKFMTEVLVRPETGPAQVIALARTRKEVGVLSNEKRVVLSEGKRVVESPEGMATAALIAACDPDTIRELLEERDALAAKVASYERAERDINEALNMGNGSYLP